jgi:hypothetical protein
VEVLVVVEEWIKATTEITNAVEATCAEAVEEVIMARARMPEENVSSVVRKAITRQPVPRTQNRKRSLPSNS